MCAAVIGRQLRQQAVLGRTNNQLSTQISSKHKPKTPAYVSLPFRPHTPLPASTNINNEAIKNSSTIIGYTTYLVGDKNNKNKVTFPILRSSNYPKVISKLATSNSADAFIAHRKQRILDAQAKKLELKRNQPKLHCTWHCFCISIKALSCGLILFIVGMIISIIGFLAEANIKEMIDSNHSEILKNKQLNHSFLNASLNLNEEVYIKVRNLTFAGPVIMGLGGIMIMAAFVLIFETRDTLGIKDSFKNKLLGKEQNLFSSENNNSKENSFIYNKDKLEIKSQNDQLFLDKYTSKQSLLQVFTVEDELSKLSAHKTNNSIEYLKNKPSKKEINDIESSKMYQVKEDLLKTNLNKHIFCSNYDQTYDNKSISFSVDSFIMDTDQNKTEQLYFGNFHSPQDTDISDTDVSEESNKFKKVPSSYLKDSFTVSSQIELNNNYTNFPDYNLYKNYINNNFNGQGNESNLKSQLFIDK